MLDTHTAVGVSMAEKLNLKRTICLATAHPAKFYQPIEKIIKTKVQFPPEIEQFFTKEQKTYKIAALPARKNCFFFLIQIQKDFLRKARKEKFVHKKVQGLNVSLITNFKAGFGKVR